MLALGHDEHRTMSDEELVKFMVSMRCVYRVGMNDVRFVTATAEHLRPWAIFQLDTIPSDGMYGIVCSRVHSRSPFTYIMSTAARTSTAAVTVHEACLPAVDMEETDPWARSDGIAVSCAAADV